MEKVYLYCIYRFSPHEIISFSKSQPGVYSFFSEEEDVTVDVDIGYVGRSKNITAVD